MNVIRKSLKLKRSNRLFIVVILFQRCNTSRYNHPKLYPWIKKYGPNFSSTKEPSNTQNEIRQLQKELKQVTDERVILKYFVKLSDRGTALSVTTIIADLFVCSVGGWIFIRVVFTPGFSSRIHSESRQDTVWKNQKVLAEVRLCL